MIFEEFATEWFIDELMLNLRTFVVLLAEEISGVFKIFCCIE
jgi:hypothetical protein